MPKVLFRIRCSGKGKPWHTDAGGRVHSYPCASVEKARHAVAVWAAEARNPHSRECLPMVVESQTVSPWTAVEEVP